MWPERLGYHLYNFQKNQSWKKIIGCSPDKENNSFFPPFSNNFGWGLNFSLIKQTEESLDFSTYSADEGEPVSKDGYIFWTIIWKQLYGIMLVLTFISSSFLWR